MASSPDDECLRTDELGFESWVAIFEEHRNDVFEIASELVDHLSLGVSAGPAGDIADVQTGPDISFDDGDVRTHDPAAIP